METHLTIKYLAGYLPYKLETIDEEINEKFLIAGFNIENNEFLVYDNIDGSIEEYSINLLKPILRPLSDLTKEIEHNGEKFVPCEEYSYLRFKEISNYKGGSNTLKFIQAREQDILLELHFDIHGLIEKGLAIDINTQK